MQVENRVEAQPLLGQDEYIQVDLDLPPSEAHLKLPHVAQVGQAERPGDSNLSLGEFFNSIRNGQFDEAIALLRIKPEFASAVEPDTKLTALHYLAQHSKKHELVKVRQMTLSILEKGANADAKDQLGSSPLHYAAANSIEMFDDLVNPMSLYQKLTRQEEFHLTPANLNNKDTAGRTPIHVAASFNMVGIFQAHINKFGQPNQVDVPDANGETPLMVAAEFGCDEIVRLLLEAGARPDFVVEKKVNENSSEQRLLHYATAKPRDRVNYNGGPVENGQVIYTGKANIVRYLSQHYSKSEGDNPNQNTMDLLMDNDNPLKVTALDIAYSNGNAEVIAACDEVVKKYIDDFVTEVTPKANETKTNVSSWIERLKTEFVPNATTASQRVSNIKTAAFAFETMVLKNEIASAEDRKKILEVVSDYTTNCLGILDSQTKWRIFWLVLLTTLAFAAGLFGGFFIAVGANQASSILTMLGQSLVAGNTARAATIVTSIEPMAEIIAASAAVAVSAVTGILCGYGFFKQNRMIKAVAEEQKQVGFENLPEVIHL